jgi:aspartate aminotransferase-like enzyme
MLGTPAPLEILALEAAVDRVSTEGLQRVQQRHRAAAAASRSGARALGLTPFARDRDAAAVATTLAAPLDTDARALAARARADRSVALSAGYGELASRIVRVDHTGQRARLAIVLDALQALGTALAELGRLQGSIQDALEAAEHAWSAEEARPLS